MKTANQSSSTAIVDGPDNRLWPKLQFGILKYVGSYLIGILACVFYCANFTEYLSHLGSFNVFAAVPASISSAIPGLYFFSQTALTGFPDLFRHSWWAIMILLIPLVCEADAVHRRRSTLRLWRPLWIGFSVGVLGTLGSIWMAVQAIPWRAKVTNVEQTHG